MEILIEIVYFRYCERFSPNLSTTYIEFKEYVIWFDSYKRNNKIISYIENYNDDKSIYFEYYND